MGCNTIHQRYQDNIPAKNLDNNTMFKCSQLTSNQVNRVELITGLEKDSCSLGLIIHGYCDVAVEQRINVLGRIYRVLGVNTKVDESQCKRRVDYSAMTSTTELVLK